jgi:hypothetical protein
MTKSNNLNKTLLIILVIQVALAGLTWSVIHRTPPVTVKEPLLNFKPADITGIEITAMQSDKEQPPVKLKKNGDTWNVTSAGNFTAKTDKVTSLLTLLTDIKIDKNSPLATSAASHAKLGVAKTSFDRKITITAGGKNITMFAGRGGRSSSTVRFQDSSNVYEAAGLSVWSISGQTSSYIDTSYIDVDEKDLTGIKITNAQGTLNFIKESDTWTIPGTGQNQTDTDTDTTGSSQTPVPDAAAIKRLAGNLSNLSISEPVGKTQKPEYGLDKATQVILTGKKDDKPFTVSYKIGAKKEGDSSSTRYVKADNKDFIVTVANYKLEDATEKTLDGFFTKEDKKQPDGPSPQMQMPASLR